MSGLPVKTGIHVPQAVHRHHIASLARCGAREFEPGKPRSKMSSVNKFVTCAACLAIIEKKRAAAKAEYAAVTKGGG